MSSVSGELTPTEVVVQENSFSHSKQKKWTSLDPEVGFIMYPIKVLSSARHALTFVGCEDKFGRSAFLDRNRMSLNLSTYLEVLQILTYRVQSTGEPFSVVIRSGEHGSNPSVDIVTAISPSIWTNTSQATSPADRSLLRLQTEGLVSVSLQMMGQHSKRTIEIGYYHDTEEHDVAVRVLWPSSPGFIVPRLADNERILLQGVFPADFCGSVPDKGIEAYVSMPFHDEGCRLLTYSYTDYRSRRFKFYVALGLRKNGETWTDIFVYEDGRGIDQDELGVVWKDYCGSGAMGRVASANFNSRTLGTSISAVTEKSRTLQIGSHSLLLNFYSPG
ncbi:hypothetical protein VKT23_008002 [Stygiomarasmius scandens]|uniref:IgGFc-binding protein N-terminal domain-containing protein n=1 Tax=Marasmiellus scandens TaxID=2682957 RepID=A0ABR1JLS1_9AGAR